MSYSYHGSNGQQLPSIRSLLPEHFEQTESTHSHSRHGPQDTAPPRRGGYSHSQTYTSSTNNYPSSHRSQPQDSYSSRRREEPTPSQPYCVYDKEMVRMRGSDHPSAPSRPARSSDPTRKYQCEQCQGSFDRQSDLNTHMKSHAEHRAYVCEESNCGKAFKTSSNLRRHVIQKHINTPYTAFVSADEDDTHQSSSGRYGDTSRHQSSSSTSSYYKSSRVR